MLATLLKLIVPTSGGAILSSTQSIKKILQRIKILSLKNNACKVVERFRYIQGIKHNY